MKKIRKIKAFKISEDKIDIQLNYTINDSVCTDLSVSSIHVRRANLFLLRHKFNSLFENVPDLFIFEIELPHIIDRQVIRRINQYMPKNVPAVILSRKSGNTSNITDSRPVKIIINKPEGTRENTLIEDAVNNFWYAFFVDN